MALHNARDVYTRRNEGVSIWVVQADAHHRVQPRREGPVLRARGRQGLPPPDVLRDPGGRAPPVNATPRRGARRRTPTSRCPRRTRHDDPRWAFGTGFEDVAGARSPHRPDGVDAADLAPYCLMLGDDALICAQRLSEWVPTRPSWRRRSRWPTPRSTCSARPGCCSRAAAATSMGAGTRRGRAGLLPRVDRVPQRRAGRDRRRPGLRAAVARLLVFSTVAARAAAPAARLARPGARRGRRARASRS